MQQRHAQAITNHARRNEGNRRAAIFERMKKDNMYDKVRSVYRDYAELLQNQARAPRMAARAPATPDASPDDSASR